MVSRAGGALTGALSGGTLGSAILPGIGTGIGALLGGIGGYLTSAPDKYKQLPTKTPEQLQSLKGIQGMLEQMRSPEGTYNRAQNYLSSILSGDPNTMNQFAAPYLQQFEQQIVPRLASRFAGIGGAHGGGAIGSSGFAQALGGAGAQLQSNLANLFANLQRGAASDVMGQYNQLAQLGLGTSPFENVFERGSTGIGGGAASGLSQVLSKYGANLLMQKLLGRSNLSEGPFGGGSSYDPYSGMQGWEFMG